MNKAFIVAISVVLLGAGGFYFASQNFKSSSNTNSATETGSTSQSTQNSGFRVTPADASLLVKFHSPAQGPAGAKVTIVEFLDPECEACGAMYPFVKKVIEEHKNDVRLVVRYMTYHQNSKLVANILEGARQENKYWEALGLIFETQSQWASHSDPKPELLVEILAPLKLNMKKIMADAKAGKYDKQILEDGEDGNKLGVNGTPTFFVNGNQLQELGYGPLKAAVLDYLNR